MGWQVRWRALASAGRPCPSFDCPLIVDGMGAGVNPQLDSVALPILASISPAITLPASAVVSVGIHQVVVLPILGQPGSVIDRWQGAGHGLGCLVDLFSIEAQRGIWHLPGATWLIATHWASWRTLSCSAACWALVSTWAPAIRVRPASRA